MRKKYMVIIFGPTGVGKTDFALQLAQETPSEIINADLGQLYTPFSIGTAKPDWKNEPVKHHLFDVISEPRDCTVSEYRNWLLPLLQDIWSRNKLPIIVGGSGFYLKSLFFPPQFESTHCDESRYEGLSPQQLWDDLNKIDPERAQVIHKNDLYRVKRALSIWYATGEKPSEYSEQYAPPSDFGLFFLTRDRQELYKRIDERVLQMINQGWIEEVASLRSTPWEPFLRKKKLIGYNELLDYCAGPQTEKEFAQAISLIQKKTRWYAKRQETFWRMFEKKLKNAIKKRKSHTLSPKIEVIDLTLSNLDLYIRQLLDEISNEQT
jgi:tRNA dimethylallyltransferase